MHEFQARVWRQKIAKRRASSSTTKRRDISPDTSFLEMLDIVNEGLTEKGEEPIAFDSDCREGICGTCSPHDQRRSPRPRSSRRCLPALHAKIQGWRNDHGRAISRPNRFRSSKIWSSIAARWIESCRPAVSSPRAPDPRRKRIRFRCQNIMPIWRWKRRRASVAAPARRRVRMRPRCSSPRRRFRISRFCRRGTGTDAARPEDGAADGRGRFRQLHQHLRMRSRLPGGNQRQLHRETESRVRDRHTAEEGRRMICRKTRRPVISTLQIVSQAHVQSSGSSSSFARRARLSASAPSRKIA